MRYVPNSFVFRLTSVLGILILLSCFVPSSLAQTQGRITGRVTDSTGAVIVGAKVTIENTGKQVSRTLETSSSGDYVAPGLEPGMYSITVEAANFKKTVRDRVQIEVGKDLKVDFQLTPGAATEVLEVPGDAPLVDATTTTLEGVLSNKAINDLPLQGRDFQNLLNLHPGVQRTAGGGFHSVTSNGLRPDDNNFIIDGATDNDVYWGDTVVNQAGIEGTPASNLPLDAIQEFNTQEDPQADFGQKPGVIVNIGIKSGTDQIHGSAYYFHRNEVFDGRNFFDHGVDPLTGKSSKAAALLLHQFGGSIGGPIIKNKWFYFANYEGVRAKVGNPFIVFTPVTQSFATPDNPAGDPTTSIVDAANAAGCNEDPLPPTCTELSKELLPFFPQNPGFTTDPDDPTAINYNFNNQTRADNLVFKSDYHLNEHHVLSGRFIYANTTQTEYDGRQVAPQWLSHAEPVTQVLGLDWTWTPNSRWVNTARFSRNSFWEKIAPLDANVDPSTLGFNTGVTDPRLFGFPTINANLTLFDDLGGVTGWPTWTSPSHTETYSDTASYTIGKHAFRFGGSFSNGGVDYLRAPDGRGVVEFDSGNDVQPMDDFFSGHPSSWSKFYGDPARNVHMRSWGLFAQDDFRATQRLTLNLGLRYDVTNPIHDSHNRLANFDPARGFIQQGFGLDELYNTNRGNFSPRLGVAWDVFGTQKTVVRAGFGMIYVQPSIRTFMFSSAGLQLNPTALIQPDGNGNLTSFLQTGADTSEITWDPAGPIFPTAVTENKCDSETPCDFFAVDRHIKTPYVINWNFNVQQAITRNTVLQVGYVANRGVHLYSDIDLNQADQSLAFQLVEDAGGLEEIWPDEGSIIQQARPFVTNCETGKGLCAPYIRFLNYLGNLSSSNFQSLQTTLTHRYSSGLYLLAGYTWEHAIDIAGNTNNLGFAPQDSLNYAAEKGNGDYDIRHRFTLSATYDLPSKKSWGQLLEGWQLTGIFQAESGQPVLLWDNSDDLTMTDEGPGNANNDRWNIIGDPGKFKVSPNGFERHFAGDPVCDTAANTPELQRGLNWAGWCWESNGTIIYPNAMGTYGNMGRNVLRGPSFVNLDFSVGKVFKLNERMKLQLRAETFNLLNHSNFASPTGNLESRNMGKLRTTPDVAASNPVIGSGGSRHIQLGLKFIW